MKLHKKIIIKGILELITGIHIGDSKENVEIGGVDSPVVRRKDNNQPYIPGSSIKGKMRSLLDVAHGKSNTTEMPEHAIGKLFGAIGPNNIGGIPSRLIVRDAYLHQESIDLFSGSEFTDMPFTEIKFENTINRVTGVATHPRQFERVPAGAKFNVEFVINIFGTSDSEANDNEQKHLQLFYSGIKLLEDDYLGGSGSRGYGQVKLTLDKPIQKPIEDYLHAKV